MITSIKYNFALLAVLSLMGLLISSCGDFLDTPAYTKKLEDNFYTTEESLNFGFAGCYNALNIKNYENKMIEFGSVLSDEAEKGGSNASDIGALEQLEMFVTDQMPANSYIKSVWDMNYITVRNCNLFLLSAYAIKCKDEADKQRKIAEVRFIRADAYFNLIRLFGDVPLILDRITTEQKDMTRTPVAVIKEKLYAELDSCRILYTARRQPLNERGRVTQGAALALKARIALHLKEYQVAKEAALAVINCGEYDLLPDYGDIFKKNHNFGVESVWEIPHTTAQVGSGDNNRGSGLPYRTRNINLGGLGYYRPTENLVNAFEKGDPRLLYTVLTLGDVVDGEVQSAHSYGSPYYSYKHNVPIAQRANDKDNNDYNLKVIRYAEVLLIYAEALLMSAGPEDEVRSYINKVRLRAQASRKTDPSRTVQAIAIDDIDIPLCTATGQTELLKAIKHERRVELAMEGVRYFDLVRWDDAKTVLQGFNASVHSLMPIPKQTMDNVGTGFVPNPGYSY